jgi:hypothetical protein
MRHRFLFSRVTVEVTTLCAGACHSVALFLSLSLKTGLFQVLRLYFSRHLNVITYENENILCVTTVSNSIMT